MRSRRSRVQARCTILPPCNPVTRFWVIAPSNAVDAAALHRAVAAIQDLGYVPRYRADILDVHMNFAGSHARRQAELDEALADPDARAIWAVRGGFGASYLLDKLDIDSIRVANKWLVGFSDISALHAAWARAGLVSMHGAVGTHLGLWQKSAQDEMADLLAHRGPTYLAGTAYQGEQAVTGRLLGGNLTVLRSLIGTGYLPDWDGAVVLFEDIGELPYRLERDLLHFYQAGLFQGVAGIVIGHLTNCDDPSQPAGALHRITTFLRQYVDVPVLADVALGHDSASSRAVVLGGLVTLDPEAGILTMHPPVAATSH